MPYLITKTLVDSWYYAMSARGDAQEDAYKEFLDTLHRMPIEQTESMQNGIDFETEVYKQAKGVARSAHPKWEEGICKVAKLLTGAPTQIRLKTPIKAAGEEILLYGILDALKAGVILDVKFSNKSFGGIDLPGKYLESSQHPIYLRLAPEAFAFEYIVSDGTDVYTERYTRKNTRTAEDVVAEFIEYLNVSGLSYDYKKCWEAR